MSEEISQNEELRDAILVEFATTAEARVEDWATHYPAHARELTYLAATQTFPAHDCSPARIERSLTLGRSILQEKRAAYLAARRASPLLSLKSAVEAKGYTPESFATALQVPVGLFWKLHRRLITFESLPLAFLDRLSQALERSVEDLSHYLRQPPKLATGASFRSDTAPAVLQESFAEALSQDPESTEAMKRHWA